MKKQLMLNKVHSIMKDIIPYCLLHYCSFKLINVEKVQDEHVEEIIKIASSEKFREESLLQAFLKVLLLYRTPDETEFKALKHKLYSFFNDFGGVNSLLLMGHLINLGSICLNSSNDRLHFTFELYKEAVESDILVEESYFPSSVYINIVHNACRVGERAWVENFVKTYGPKLPGSDEFRKNVAKLSEAYLYSIDNQHKEAIKSLAYVYFDDFTFGMRFYILLMKSLYEEQKQDAFLSIIDKGGNYKTYLRRAKNNNKINTLVADRNILFVKCLIKIARYSPSKHHKGYFIISEYLEELKGKNVVEKTWLIEKVEELLSRFNTGKMD